MRGVRGGCCESGFIWKEPVEADSKPLKYPLSFSEDDVDVERVWSCAAWGNEIEDIVVTGETAN